MMFIKNPEDGFRILLEVIPVGEENAISMRTLAERLSTDCRQVRKAVERARCGGCIIAGSDAGYFVPANMPELRSFYNRQMARIRTNSRSLRAVRARLKQEDGNADA